MIDASQYLEAAKIEEIAADFEAQGYQVVQDAQDYDLVAQKKNGEKIAVEVKARSRLREAASQISSLREKALQSGFNEFRLVVVNPPHATNVHIDALPVALHDYFIGNVPGELKKLASSVSINNVSDIDVQLIQIDKNLIHVVGDGVIDVTLTNGGSLQWDFPFSFDIVFDGDLKVKTPPKINLDLSSYEDPQFFLQKLGT